MLFRSELVFFMLKTEVKRPFGLTVLSGIEESSIEMPLLSSAYDGNDWRLKRIIKMREKNHCKNRSLLLCG